MCSPPSMANHHPRLAKLARDLAYKKGEILTLTEREQALLTELDSVRSQKLLAEQAGALLAAKIQAFELDANDVRGIQARPRNEGARHGSFRKTLAQTLQMFAESLTTSEILEILRAVEDSGLKLPEGREDAMHRIAHELRVLRDRGWVLRTDGGGAGVKASWLWIGEKPTNQE